MIVWPVYVYLAIQLFGLGVSIAKHGEYVKLKNNASEQLFRIVDIENKGKVNYEAFTKVVQTGIANMKKEGKL